MYPIDSQKKTDPNTSSAIAYSDVGQKGNAILLIHGLFDHKGTWDWMAPHLNGRRLVTPDLLGHGESNKIVFSSKTRKTGLTPDLHSSCIRDLIIRLDLNDFIIGGSSYGGAIALNTYIRYPEIRERVKSIVLVAAAGYSQSIPSYVKHMGGWLGNILQKPQIHKFCYQSGILKAGIRRSVKRCFYNPQSIPNGLVNDLFEQCSNIRLIEGYHLTTRSLMNIDFEIIQKNLSSVTCPALIIWGLQDQIIPAKNALSYANDLPNAEIAWIESCGHAPHIEQAKKTGECISTFAVN